MPLCLSVLIVLAEGTTKTKSISVQKSNQSICMYLLFAMFHWRLLVIIESPLLIPLRTHLQETVANRELSLNQSLSQSGTSALLSLQIKPLNIQQSLTLYQVIIRKLHLHHDPLVVILVTVW